MIEEDVMDEDEWVEEEAEFSDALVMFEALEA
jgi:hypothetical protein